MNKKLKKEIRGEIGKEISSRFFCFLTAAILSTLLFFSWRGFLRSVEGIAGFYNSLGAAVIVLILVIVSVLNMFLWVIPLTEGGLNTQ